MSKAKTQLIRAIAFERASDRKLRKDYPNFFTHQTCVEKAKFEARFRRPPHRRHY